MDYGPVPKAWAVVYDDGPTQPDVFRYMTILNTRTNVDVDVHVDPRAHLMNK